MVLVAVAGGTSPTLGKSIVEAILATKKHEVIIISRSKPGSSSISKQSEYNAPIRYADYTSTTSLTSALKGVHTLISVVKLTDATAMIDLHKTLLQASKANNISRFIMSDWSMSTTSHTKVDMLAHKRTLLDLCNEENSSPEPNVACSTIQVGAFMNYFAQGSPWLNTASQELVNELTAGLVDDFMLNYIDIGKGKLCIPSTSAGEPITMSTTHILDIGALVAASLDLAPEKFKGNMGLVSQDVDLACVREVLVKQCGLEVPERLITRAECDEQIAAYEKKMKEAQDQGRFDLQALMGWMVAQMEGVACDGESGGSVIPATFNEVLRQGGIDVKTRRVEDLVLKAWGAE